MIYKNHKKINDAVSSAIKDEGLNFARLILPESCGELSVIGKYLPELIGGEGESGFIKDDKRAWAAGYVTLDKSLEPIPLYESDAFYYGASPRLNASLIISAISSLSIKSEEELVEFIRKNSRLFMLHSGQEKYLLPMAEYITVCVCHNFGIKLTLAPEEISALIGVTDMDKRYLELTEDGTVKLHGCPTEKTLAFLRGLRYSEIEAGHFRSDANGEESIESIYANTKNIIFINGANFYSGVLPRVLFIEEKERWHSNKGITSLYLYYERSTYATVFSLDRDYTSHPLLRGVRDAIIEFFRYDDEQKLKYLDKPTGEGDLDRGALIASVNEYLAHSYNVNQIVVSGNIITSDGILIVCERGKDEIDAGKLYPSVNGNVEIADRDVEFYTDSAYVDFPTIELSRLQNGFSGELCRETEAELNISLSNNLWHCTGIALLGTMPKRESEPSPTQYPNARRRMHFSILYEQRVSLSFEDITKAQKSAVERHETRRILGLSLSVYKSPLDFFKKSVYNVLSAISRWKLVITSIFTLAIFFSIRSPKTLLEDMSKAASAVFAALVVIIALLDIRKKLSKLLYRRSHVRRLRISAMAEHERISEKLDRFLTPYLKGKEHYPITYLALDTYITNSCKPTSGTKGKKTKTKS